MVIVPKNKIKACVVVVAIVVHHNQIQLKVIFETISAVELRSLSAEWMCVRHFIHQLG